MRIGIVTTWFERGAAYVSRQYKELLEDNNDIFVFARGGEYYAKGDKNWDTDNVFWSKKLYSPFSVFTIDKREFIKWIKDNNIEIILFNEQRWYTPLLWCKELNVKTIAYVDYYKENELHLFNAYDGLICNTKRHYSVFKSHTNAIYIPWGTDINIFKRKMPKPIGEKVTFFHSCGMAPYRKGTDLIIEAFYQIKLPYNLIIHTQVDIVSKYPELEEKITEMIEGKKLKIINKSVKWPGLYHLGDVYLYPSRLDGIGLSLIEAVATGLAIVTTDNPPMNEFVEDNGTLVKVSKYTSRFDGYYWPYSHASVEDLKDKVLGLINDKVLVETYKENSEKLAERRFNWVNNKAQLEYFFQQTLNADASHDDELNRKAIFKYENEGFKNFNKYIIKYQGIFQFFRRIIFGLKSKLWQ